MIIDTTISFFQKSFSKATSMAQYNEKMERLTKSINRRRRSRFPGGIYDNKKEHSEFRQLCVREFLDKNHLDSDIDLESTIVFWKNGEIVAVVPMLDNQNTSKLSASSQN